MINPLTPQRFFAASNSHRGFCNYFGALFSSPAVDHLYIIKGGPGTGKSYFMKTVARRAGAAGYAVTEYACSSDPASLDGLILRHPERPTIGFVDGTAPHTAEVHAPGIREELIDLGIFWDTERLLHARDTIALHSAAKAVAYADAYAHLRAAGEMEVVAERRMEGVLRLDRIHALVNRLLRGLPGGRRGRPHGGAPDGDTAGGSIMSQTAENGQNTAKTTVAQPWRNRGRTVDPPCIENHQMDISEVFETKKRRWDARGGSTTALRRAIGMTGRVTLPTYERMADTVVVIGETHTPAERMVAFRVMGCLYDESMERGYGCLVSRDPVYPELVDGLFYPHKGGGTAVLIGGHTAEDASDMENSLCGMPARRVSLRSCLDHEALRGIRTELRRVDGMRVRHEEEAILALSRVREAHFALEALYTAAMNIPAKEAFCESLCARILDGCRTDECVTDTVDQ